MKYMPEGIVSYDHAEAVNALAQGDVAMITEWSAFYSTLTSPETSKIGDCLAVAPEPKGPAGRKPALGGFSLAVATQADDAEKAAGWLFIQWLTSKANAQQVSSSTAAFPARQSVYADPGAGREVHVRAGAGRNAGRKACRSSVRASPNGRPSPRSCRSGAPR